MGVVYLTTAGTSLRRKGKILQLFHGKKKLGDLRPFGLERLVVAVSVQISAQALAFLLDEGVDVSFITQTGRLRGSLVSTESPNVYLRLAQFDRFRDDAFRLRLSAKVAVAKVEAQRSMIARAARNHPKRVDSGVVPKLDALRARIGSAETLDQIRGFEGQSAALYYKQLPGMLSHVGFPGRQRRPPKDPVNALLSLGYVLLTNEIGGGLQAHGFDPAVGYFHGLRYGRQSLALDLVEPFRQPIIDRLTLRLFNLRTLGPDDFEGGEKGMRLSDEKFKEYLREYEARMRAASAGNDSPPWREAVRAEIRKLKEMVLSGEVVDLYTWSG